MKYPTMALAAFLLTSCGQSTVYGDGGYHAATPCARPVEVPVKALSAREVAFYWTTDRQSLVECGAVNGVVE